MSVDTARSLTHERDDLVREIQKIQNQLSIRKAALVEFRTECFTKGRREDYYPAEAEYLKWKGRATGAMHHLVDELAQVKLQLRDQSVTQNESLLSSRFYRLRRAIQDHQRATLSEDYEPTQADLDLWDTLAAEAEDTAS